jgi:hypothetical protein
MRRIFFGALSLAALLSAGSAASYELVGGPIETGSAALPHLCVYEMQRGDAGWANFTRPYYNAVTPELQKLGTLPERWSLDNIEATVVELMGLDRLTINPNRLPVGTRLPVPCIPDGMTAAEVAGVIAGHNSAATSPIETIDQVRAAAVDEIDELRRLLHERFPALEEQYRTLAGRVNNLEFRTADLERASGDLGHQYETFAAEQTALAARMAKVEALIDQLPTWALTLNSIKEAGLITAHMFGDDDDPIMGYLAVATGLIVIVGGYQLYRRTRRGSRSGAGAPVVPSRATAVQTASPTRASLVGLVPFHPQGWQWRESNPIGPDLDQAFAQSTPVAPVQLRFVRLSDQAILTVSLWPMGDMVATDLLRDVVTSAFAQPFGPARLARGIARAVEAGRYAPANCKIGAAHSASIVNLAARRGVA